MGNPNWKKGVSGNPTGRPKAVVRLAQECQKHAGEVVALMLHVMRGEEIERTVVRAGPKGKLIKAKVRVAPSFADQMDAAKWFADRGFGKAATVLAGEGGVGPSEIVVRLETPLPVIAIEASEVEDESRRTRA